jgi:hypothetical protein
MRRVVTSYSLLPETKVKIELLAHGMGKPISRLLDDLVDECWKKNADKIRGEKLPPKYMSSFRRLLISLFDDEDEKVSPEQLLKTGLSNLPHKRRRKS